MKPGASLGTDLGMTRWVRLTLVSVYVIWYFVVYFVANGRFEIQLGGFILNLLPQI